MVYVHDVVTPHACVGAHSWHVLTENKSPMCMEKKSEENLNIVTHVELAFLDMPVTTQCARYVTRAIE